MLKKSQLKNYLVLFSIGIVGVAFLLAFTLSSQTQAINPSDYLVMVKNTLYCSDNCYTEYDVINPTPSNLAVPPNFIQWLGRQSTYNKKISYYANESYFYQEWLSNITCSPYQKTVNWTFTEQNCTDNGILLNHSGNVTKLKPFIASEIDKNTKLRIRVEGKLKPNSYEDNIVFFNGYNYTEYASWNSSFGGATIINLTKEMKENYTIFEDWIPVNASLMDATNAGCEAQIRVWQNNTPAGEQSESVSASYKGNNTHCYVVFYYNTTVANASNIFYIYYNHSQGKPEYRSITNMYLANAVSGNLNDTVYVSKDGDVFNFTIGSNFLSNLNSPTAKKGAASMIVMRDGGVAISGGCNPPQIEYNSSAFIVMNMTGCTNGFGFRYYFYSFRGYFKFTGINSVGYGGSIIDQFNFYKSDNIRFLNASPHNVNPSNANFSNYSIADGNIDPAVDFGFALHESLNYSDHFFVMSNLSRYGAGGNGGSRVANRSKTVIATEVIEFEMGTAAGFGQTLNFSENHTYYLGFMPNMSFDYALFYKQVMNTPTYKILGFEYNDTNPNIAPIVRNISIMPTTIYRNSIVNVTFNLTDDTNTTFNVTAVLYRNGILNFSYVNMTYRANTSMTINASPTTWVVGDKLYWNLTSSDGTDNSGINTTATITVLNRLPIINLSSPANNTEIANLPNVTFRYNHSDADSDTSVCNTTLNNNLINSTNVSTGQQINFTYLFNTNNYSMTWNVSCWDGYNRTNSNNYNVSLLRDNIAQNASIILSATTIESHYVSLEINISCGDASICYLNLTNSDGTLLTKSNNLSVFDLLIGYDNQTVLGNVTVWVVSNDTLNNKNITSKQYNLTDTNALVINTISVASITTVGNNISFSAEIVEHNVSSSILNFSGFDYTYSLNRISGNNFSVTIVTNTTFPTTINYNLTANDSSNNQASKAGSFSIKYPALPSKTDFIVQNQYYNYQWNITINWSSETMLNNVTLLMTSPNGSIEFNRSSMKKAFRIGENEQWYLEYFDYVNGTFSLNFTATNTIGNSTTFDMTVTQTFTISIVPSGYARAPPNLKTDLVVQEYQIYASDVRNIGFNCTLTVQNSTQMFEVVSLVSDELSLNTTNVTNTVLAWISIQGNDSAVDGKYNVNASCIVPQNGFNYSINGQLFINPPSAIITLYNSTFNGRCNGTLGRNDIASCKITSTVTQNVDKTFTIYFNNSGSFSASNCSILGLSGKLTTTDFGTSANSTNSTIVTFRSGDIGENENTDTISIKCYNASSLGYPQSSANNQYISYIVSAPPTPAPSGGGGGAILIIKPNETLALNQSFKVTLDDRSKSWRLISLAPAKIKRSFIVENTGISKAHYIIKKGGNTNSWLSFTPTEFDLEPGQIYDLTNEIGNGVLLTIEVPKEAEYGRSYYNFLSISNNHGTIVNVPVNIEISQLAYITALFSKFKQFTTIFGLRFPKAIFLILIPFIVLFAAYLPFMNKKTSMWTILVPFFAALSAFILTMIWI